MDKNEIQTAAYSRGSRTALDLHMQTKSSCLVHSTRTPLWRVTGLFGPRWNNTSWDLKTLRQIPPQAKPETASAFSLAFILPAAHRKSLHALKSAIFTPYLDLISAVCTLCFAALTLKAGSSGTDAHSFLMKSSVVVRREVLLLPISTMS